MQQIQFCGSDEYKLPEDYETYDSKIKKELKDQYKENNKKIYFNCS